MLALNERIGPALRVVETLRGSGYEALLAGGCVRDFLLGRTPGDFDVATSAPPDRVREMFSKVIPVGERFGVVLVLVEGEPVEVATFRRDAAYEDGRRPVAVTFTEDPEEDAVRRDFTVNGMFFDPESGDVVDFVGGREDLDRGIVRSIGPAGDRFDEDRLRMLRAVRFAVGLGFELEAETFDAIRDRASEIALVSGERIRDELLKILAGDEPRRGLELLRATGLLAEILPEVDRMVDVPQPARFHPEGDVYTHTLAAVGSLERPSRILALATLLHDVGKPATIVFEERVRFDGHPQAGARMAEEICRRLKLSRDETSAVSELVHKHLMFMNVQTMREARLRRFLTGPLAEDHLELHRADSLGCGGDLATYRFCRTKRAEYLSAPPPPPRLVSGDDLKELGLPPGPLYSLILKEAADLTLEGVLRTREEALDWAVLRVRELR